MSTPASKTRHFEPELRKQAEAAALLAGYGNDNLRREVFACGYYDSRSGVPSQHETFRIYEREYDAGFDAGTEATAHAEMLANAIPARTPAMVPSFPNGTLINNPDRLRAPMTLGAFEDIDFELTEEPEPREPPCRTCGAVVIDGKCQGCGGKCAVCECPLDEMGYCPNDDCPSNGQEAAE